MRIPPCSRSECGFHARLILAAALSVVLASHTWPSFGWVASHLAAVAVLLVFAVAQVTYARKRGAFKVEHRRWATDEVWTLGEQQRRGVCAAPGGVTVPFVSIIVPAHNESHVLPGLAGSLSQLRYPLERVQVIVVNDRSTDKSEQVLGELQKKHTWLEVVHRPVSAPARGKSGAMNAGYALLHADADIVGYVDADTAIDAFAIQDVVHTFECDEDIAAVQAAKIIHADYCTNLLTKLQFWEFVTDSMVHRTRQSSGGCPDLHGNGQFLKRAIIDDMGAHEAWNEDSVTDDLDMTAQLVMNGQRIVMMQAWFSVREQPVATTSEVFSQRQRWTIGGFQRLVDYWGSLLPCASDSPAARSRKLEFVQLLTIQYFFASIVVCDLVISTCLLRPHVFGVLNAASGFTAVLLCFVAMLEDQGRYITRSFAFPALWAFTALVVMMNITVIAGMAVIDTALRPRALEYAKSLRAEDRVDSHLDLSRWMNPMWLVYTATFLFIVCGILPEMASWIM